MPNRHTTDEDARRANSDAYNAGYVAGFRAGSIDDPIRARERYISECRVFIRELERLLEEKKRELARFDHDREGLLRRMRAAPYADIRICDLGTTWSDDDLRSETIGVSHTESHSVSSSVSGGHAPRRRDPGSEHV